MQMKPTGTVHRWNEGIPSNPLGLRCNRRQLALGAAALAVGAASTAKAAPAEIVEITPPPIADPNSYDVYVPTACKTGPFYHYTCEFDAAWAVMKTFGIDASLDEQIAAI